MPVTSRVSVPHGAKRSVNCWDCQILPDLSLFPTLSCIPIEDQLCQRTDKMYNGIWKGHNPKLLLLLQLITNADNMGIMGNMTRVISNRWLCGFNRLERNFVESQCQEIATRVSLITDVTTCEIPGLTSDEIVVINFCPLLSSCKLISPMT